jgi:dienelactone hydrolase
MAWMTGLAVSAFVCLALASAAHGAVQTKAIEYKDGDVTLEGYLAWDDAIQGKRPGVLVVHEWWGLNDYPKARARQLAEMGYVAFALDMYGKGVVAKTAQEAQALTAPFRTGTDRALMRRRAAAGLAVLQKQDLVDAKRIAAIGYCFGGMTVLELARSGADIAGVVSFHGGLDTPNPDDAKKIKAKVLVCNGAADKSVPAEQIKAFTESMNAAGVDWSIISYGGAVHAFTNPASGNDPSTNVAYNAAADRRSWQAMKDFFAEIFAEPKAK